MSTKKNTKKIWNFPKITFALFFICLFLLYLQFAYLSLSGKIYGKNMTEFASNRSTVTKTISATRGTIYDNNQNILATNVSSYTVIAYLEKSRGSRKEDYVKDVQATAEALAPILNMEVEALVTLMSKDLYQVELGPGGRGITELTKEEIRSLSLSGIDFVESQKRYYPNGDFASYVVGYAKTNVIEEEGNTVSEIVGELGIEAGYNDLLKGTDGYLKYQQDRYGYKISGTKENKVDAADGYDIYLTVDSSIQRFVESAVKSVNETYKPEWLQVTVMDAKTGDILASTTTPSFDPNIRDIKSYENPLVTLTFEPGSVMKTYTYMCALESGKYDSNATFQSGSINIYDVTISDWNRDGWGTINYDKGYEYSSNVGIVNLINNYLSKKELRDCFKKYGFGKTTGIELSKESEGTLNFNYAVDVANAGFGQGITSTAIQQLQSLTIVANDGYMLKPHIVKEIVDSNTGATYYEREIVKGEQLVAKSTTDKMRELMYNTVHGTDGGTTAKAYNVEGLEVIGKTGTSQIYNNATGTYEIDRNGNNYIFSFAGMFPSANPEYIIYAAMKKPTWGKTLGTSTVTTDIMKSIAKYENLDSQESETKEAEYGLTSYINKDVNSVKQELEARNLNVVIIGDGNKVINQSPSTNMTVVSGDKVFLLTNSTNYNMPNIMGWSRNNVKTYFDLIGVPIEIESYGYATSQSLAPGALIGLEQPIHIVFTDKITE